ncbi:MAG: MarR family transcriptional regulator [Dehalococcoidales bacterium]|nr:MarR family transcriptional regulator [Dehalococcoidales bacterium]
MKALSYIVAQTGAGVIIKITDSELSFIEEVGVVFEQTGLPRMAGRLFGWLIISDPPYQSPGELAEVLRASKGSISTSIRLLTQMGFIERHVIPGSRHDHFQLSEEAIKKTIQHGLEQEIKMFRSLAERGLEMMKDITPKRKAWLKEMQSRYAYLEKAFPVLLEKYEREKNQ